MSQNIVIITGTSTGLGLSTAVLLAKDAQKQYKVYACMRNLAKKEELVTKAADCVDKTLFVLQMDVCSEASVDAAIKEVFDKEGKVDVLINNAAVGIAGSLECCKWDDIMNTFNTNVYGTMRTIRAVVPSMKKLKKGHIINITSIGGLIGLPFNGVYGATKYAVEGLSECLAAELLQFNVKVSLIEPGPIATPFVANAQKKPPQEPSDQQTKEMLGKLFQKIATTWYVDGVQQTGDEVAEYVVKAIKAEKPHLHYFTNKQFEGIAKMKYADLTGDAMLEKCVQTYFG